MDILMLNPFFYPYPGGTEKHILEVGKRLAKKHAITVLAAQMQNTEPQEEIFGMRVVRTPAKILYSLPHPLPPPMPIMPNLVQDIRRELAKAEAMHIHNRFVFGPDIGKLAVDGGKKLFLTLHNSRPVGIDLMTDFFGCLWDDWFAKRLMRMCTGVMGVSQDTLDMTLPKGFSKPTKVIYNGIDERFYRPAKPSREWMEYFAENEVKLPVVFSNARLLPQKGLHHLVDAMRGIDAGLVILGRGPLKDRLRAQAKANGVNIHFISNRITDKSLAGLYNSIDLFVLPSLYEPCGIAMLEAMGCAKPCIGSRIGGLKEIIQHGKSGILAEPASPRQLHESICLLLSDRKLALRIGKEARKRVLREFTWDIVASKVGRFYDELK
ncbi:MAG: glycosyltransferase family 4 protein [Candidatus Micrarchaeota archaeon]|nr:glycosyltransferase family 4 protein [Candidatus Micrarchaeota archaeon]